MPEAKDVSKSDEKQIIVVAQKDGSIESPKDKDLYEYGTLATVMKVFGMPDNSKSVEQTNYTVAYSAADIVSTAVKKSVKFLTKFLFIYLFHLTD